MPDARRIALELEAPTFTFAEPAAGVDGPLVLEVPCALPWDVEVRANAWGDVISFAPGSVDTAGDASRVKLLLDHRPKPFGYGLELTDDGTRLGARMAIPRDELADPEIGATVRQMRNGVRDAVSVGVDLLAYTSEPIDPDDRSFFAPERIRVTAAELLELSSAVIPRFAEARHRPLAASSEPRRFTVPASALTLSPIDPEPDEPDEPTPPGDDRAAMHRRALETLAGLPAIRVVGGPLARFATFADYARARLVDPEIPSLGMAWVDQLTTENPGVMQPSWLSEVRGIIDNGRPFITALGGPASAGDSGMELNWPYFDGVLTDLVGKQTAEKTEITSVKVSLKRGNAPLMTLAGGSDLSLQLIERSSPSYLDAYLRIMSAAYAQVSEREATTAAQTASTDHVIVALATADADAIAGAIFAASIKVRNATGLPANVVAAASDVYPAVAAAVLKLSAPSANVAGAAASAATLRVELAGLAVVEAPYLTDGTGLVTNRQAFVWAEDGPRTISAPDVPKLGRDVAVYGFGGPMPFTPAGIVELLATAPVAARASRSKE